MEQLQIRSVKPADLDDCYTIELLCYTSDAASREKIEKRIDLFPEGFLVAEWQDQMVGFINSGSTNNEDITDEALKDMVGHEADGRNIVIFSLAVHPNFQGRGFSKALLLAFLKAARQLNKATVLLMCKTKLIPYYRNFGFKYSGPSASTHGGFSWHEMYLPLAARHP